MDPDDPGEGAPAGGSARREGDAGFSAAYRLTEEDLVAGIRLTQRANALAAALTPLVAVPLAYLAGFVANGTPGSFRGFLGDAFHVWHLGMFASLVLVYLGYILVYRVRRKADEAIAEMDDPFRETLVEADPSGVRVTAGDSTVLAWEDLERSWEGDRCSFSSSRPLTATCSSPRGPWRISRRTGFGPCSDASGSFRRANRAGLPIRLWRPPTGRPLPPQHPPPRWPDAGHLKGGRRVVEPWNLPVSNGT